MANKNNIKNKRDRRAHYNNRPDSKFTKGMKEKANTFKKGKNDISWYNKDAILTKMASVTNFLYPIGQKFYLGRGGITETHIMDGVPGYDDMPEVIPGIMVCTWMPTPGISIDANSAINVAGAKRFTKMMEKNWSGNSAYDIPDVSFILEAGDSMFAAYALATLVYSHISNYLFTNRYYPRAIVQGLGFDFDDLINHEAEFATWINRLKHRIENIKIPKDVAYINRHMHMCAHVYKDADIEKAQLYIPAPKYLFRYDPTIPACVEVDFHPTTPMTFAVFKTKVESMVNALIPDQEATRIFADILKYISDNTWTVNEIDFGHQELPVYDREMLWQLHNADLLSFHSATGLSITQIVNSNLDPIIYWNPTFVSDEYMMICKRVIDSDTDSPSPEEIVESTRLKFTIANPESVVLPTTPGGTFTFNLSSCGSELLLNVSIIFMNPQDGGKICENPITTFVKIHRGSATFDGVTRDIFGVDMLPLDQRAAAGCSLSADAWSLFGLGSFNYRPLVYVGLQRNPGTMYNAYFGLMGEIGNIAIIEDSQLYALHDACLLSMFDA